MSSYSLCDFSEDTGVGGLFGSTRLFLYLIAKDLLFPFNYTDYML